MSYSIRNGKPGERWHVFSTEDNRWAVWEILDGELLERAHELGYEGNVAVCIETNTHQTPVEEMYAMTQTNSPLFKRDKTATWWKGP